MRSQLDCFHHTPGLNRILSQDAVDSDGRWTCPLVITKIARRIILDEATKPVSVAATNGSVSAGTSQGGLKGDDSLEVRPAAEPPSRPTKQALIIDLLARPCGASLAELIVVTGWLPHTVRAALVRLKQNGRKIEGEQGQGKIRRYRLNTAA